MELNFACLIFALSFFASVNFRDFFKNAKISKDKVSYFDFLFEYVTLNFCAKFEPNRLFEYYHLQPNSACFSHGHALLTFCTITN